jgi:hypothetical protein
VEAFLKRFAYRRWVMGTALALGLAGRGDAQVPVVPPVIEQISPDGQVPSPMPPLAGLPEGLQVPEGMNPYTMPGPTAARPYRPSSPVLVNDQVWFAWYGSASRRAMLAPNMFGDLTGTRPIGFSPFSISLTTGGTGGTGGASGRLNAFILDTGGIRATYTANGSTTLTPAIVVPTYLGTTLPNNQPFTTTVPTFNTLAVPITENTTITQAIANARGQGLVFNPASQALLANPVGGIYNVQLIYDVGTAGTAGAAGTTSVVPVFTLFLPNPSGGGIVGRTKVSTDNSPIPRDRIIANYDFVSNSKIVPGGLDFNRFCFGFEKTFFDGVTSVEVRVPFASTANGTTDGMSTEGSHAELGNVAMNFKALLAGGDIYSLAAGCGFSLPTASDTRVQVGNTDLIRVLNQAIICTPYVALGFTPSDRVFGQFWAGFAFDTTGNPVKLNTGSGLNQIGKLNDPFGLQLDAQLGFWLLHPATRQSSILRGLAPFTELHFNRTLTSTDAVQSGSIGIADFQGGFDETSLSAGVVAQIQDNVNLSAGVTSPLRNGNNRFGDYQLGFRLNWFFGATADARARAIPYY